jgi:hypothetical protein
MPPGAQPPSWIQSSESPWIEMDPNGSKWIELDRINLIDPKSIDVDQSEADLVGIESD